MPDYSHCVIYKLINIETRELLYIGSTCNFNKRRYDHKKAVYNQNKRDYNMNIYSHIRELGGWDSVDMIMVEEFRDCQNDLQRRKKECEYIDQMKPKCNHNCPVLKEPKCNSKKPDIRDENGNLPLHYERDRKRIYRQKLKEINNYP
jgi:predicted GIY-YIG superfamily endonuclease